MNYAELFHGRAARNTALALVLTLSGMPLAVAAQQPAPAAPVAKKSQAGTVKAISGNQITLGTDAGQQYLVQVPDGTRLLQVAPGSKDLTSAQAIQVSDIAIGDKLLVTGAFGSDANAATLTASRVVLMKSGDIAQKHAAEQADWQRRGSGGIVTAVDPAAGSLTLSAGARKVMVTTTPQTIYRRYAGDSIKFEDAKPGTAAEIRVGDQVRVRGDKSGDPATGLMVKADEVVSGSFKNLAGVLSAVNATAGTVTLKDLTTKQVVTVQVSANSDVRTLPPEIAARFAARSRAAAGGAPAGAGAPAAGGAAGAGQGGGPGAGAAGAGAGRPGGGAGMDLSQMISRLPAASLATLKVGDAVMIVASQSASGGTVTAVTMLSGVEPILAATPTGQSPLTLSPWGVGGAPGDAGGGA